MSTYIPIDENIHFLRGILHIVAMHRKLNYTVYFFAEISLTLTRSVQGKTILEYNFRA